MVSLKRAEQGVTIIELMIATTIFAVILVIIMSAYMFVTKDYSKAYVEAQTQNATRSIAQQISQYIELSAGLVTSNDPLNGAFPLLAAADGTQGLCVGGYRYSVLFNTEIGNGTNDALVVDNLPNCNPLNTSAQAIKAGPLTSTSKELLSKGMRVGQFSVTALPNSSTPGSTVPAVPGRYSIKVEVAYGDDTSQSGPLHVSGAGYNYSYSCDTISQGGSFCAVSSLNTFAQARLSNQTE